MAHLETFGRQGTCHRCHQRKPHNAFQHTQVPVGRRPSETSGHSKMHSAKSQGLRMYLLQHKRGGLWIFRSNRIGNRGPAVSTFWTGMLQPWGCKKHLRNRLLHVDEHRRKTCHVRKSFDDNRSGLQGKNPVRAGGKCLCRRCGNQVAQGRA